MSATLRPRQRVRIVDVKGRHNLSMIGAEGTIGYQPHGAKPLRFLPATGHRTFPIDTARHPGSRDAVIVEPIE